jgi:hypothetical protein
MHVRRVLVSARISVTDRSCGGSSEFRAARLAAAQGHARFIRHRVAALVSSDQQLTTQITAATKDIDALTFREAHGIDYHAFKDAPNPEPDPPPGGWSSDPLMRAAQKIANGHALKDHAKDFPGMTKDQLADLIYSKMKRSIEIQKGCDSGPVAATGRPLFTILEIT